MSFSDMLSITEWYMGAGLFRVGTMVVKQVLGVPMGGRLSKALSSVTLCGMEFRWHQGRPERQEHNLACWPKVVKGCRFVDDGLWHAHSLCTAHVHAGLAMYEHPLRAEMEDAGSKVKWLDMDVKTANGQISAAMHGKNSEFIKKQVPAPVHHPVPWWHDRDRTLVNRIFWFLASRAHRLNSIHVCWREAMKQMMDVAEEARMFGAPPRIIITCLNKLHRLSFMSQVIGRLRTRWTAQGHIRSS